MDARIRPTAGDRRVYEDFVPSHELRTEEGPVPTFVVRLPGFKREQIKVQIDNYGKLRISGERPLADNRWSRFRKDFQAPENCNVSEVRAKFENEVLEVMLPKLIKEPQQQPPQKPEVMKPSAAEDDTKPKAVPAEPNDTTAKKQEEEKKKMEQIEERKVPQKVEEKEEEQRKDEKPKEKVAEAAAVDKEGEKGDVVTGVAEKETGGVSNWAGKLKQLGLRFYKPKHPMVNVVVAIAVLVGVGVYLYYKLNRTILEKGGL